MTKTEWNLRKENAHLMMRLMESQSRLLQAEYDKAKAVFESLGEEWKEQDNVVELKPAETA